MDLGHNFIFSHTVLSIQDNRMILCHLNIYNLKGHNSLILKDIKDIKIPCYGLEI